MTRAMVSIPIVNDTIVEGNEDFDVVLQPGSPGIGIGTPGRAVVTIIDDNDGKDYMVCILCCLLHLIYSHHGDV